MSFFSRLFIYLLLGGAAFLVGRFVFPASGSVFHPEQAEAMEHKIRQQFWQDKIHEVLVDPEPIAAAEALMSRMTPEDFPAVADGFAGNDALRVRLATRWASVDPASGFKYLANSDLRTAGQQQMASALVSGWARRDFNSAEAAASRLRVSGVEPDPMKSLAVLVLRQDIRKGLAYLQKNTISLPDAVMLQELQVTDMKSERWQGATLDQRMDLLQNLADSPWKEAGLDQLYAILLKGNPADLLRSVQTDGRGLKLATPAAEAWVNQDASAAAVFFQNEAKDQVKATLGLALARTFADKEPAAAWEFVQTNLSGQTRATAKLAVLNAQSKKDPVIAARWLKDLPEAPWRTEALQFLNATWSALDPAASKDWREKTLSPQDQRSIVEKS